MNLTGLAGLAGVVKKIKRGEESAGPPRIE